MNISRTIRNTVYKITAVRLLYVALTDIDVISLCMYVCVLTLFNYFLFFFDCGCVLLPFDGE